MNRQGLATGVVVISLLALGCARQPVTTAASSPPPTGATASSAARSSGPIQAAARQGGVTTAGRSDGSTSKTPARPSPSEFVVVDDVQDIHFDFDKYAIRPADAQILDRNAGWLKANARDLLLIEGHCDERGTNEYNVALGERRAKTTMDYLVAHGVAAARITVISYGEERPLCTTHDENCWAKNRRAHFLVERG
jgi:peptidoglycan-associated lipoprotein